MLTNYHTHTNYCDGANTAEEMVLAAIEKGFSAIGFSGHAYAPYGIDYCMSRTDEYISEVKALKEKYKGQIEVYLGTEEDMLSPTERERYEYIIGSSHHILKNGVYYCIDESREKTEELIEVYGGDVISVAEDYYKNFCEYILTRKPDIIGHFDLITKFDEQGEPFFLGNPEYHRIAEKYVKAALKSGSLFEVNTGALSRGLRRTPYPYEDILRVIWKEGGNIILSSDSHSTETLDFGLNGARELLKDIGFKEQFVLTNGRFTKIEL